MGFSLSFESMTAQLKNSFGWLFSQTNDSRQPLFEKYAASVSQLQSAGPPGSRISGCDLPEFRIFTICLRLTGQGRYEATLFDSQEPQAYQFETRSSVLSWLQASTEADVWEVIDQTGDAEKIDYYLHSAESNAYESFQTDNALFERLCQKAGPEWKVKSITDDCAILMHGAYGGSPKKFSCSPRDLATPVHFNERAESSRSRTQPASKLLLVFGLALTGKGAAALPNTSPMSVAEGPISLNVFPGESVNVSLPDLFKDREGDPLDFQVREIPSFLQLIPKPLEYQGNLADGDGQGGSEFAGGFLHTFGGKGTGLLYRVVSLNQPLKAVSIQPQFVQQYFTGAVSREFFWGSILRRLSFLAGGADPVKIYSVLPTGKSSSWGHTIPASSSIRFVGIDPAQPILWMSDGSDLRGVNFDPGNASVAPAPKPVGSFQEDQEITGISFGENGRIIIISSPGGGIRIVNGSNPFDLSSIGFISSSDTLHSISCRNSTCYVAQGDGGVHLYVVSGSQPVKVGSYPSVDGASYRSVFQRGLLFTARSDQPVVDILDVADPAQPALYRRVRVANPPYSVTSEGNRFVVSTTNGREVYALNQDRIEGVPEMTDRGVHHFTITASDFNGGSIELPVILEVKNRDPVVAYSVPVLQGIVGQLFSYAIPKELFSDPDDPIQSLNITVDKLPSFASFAPAELIVEGIPDATGFFSFRIVAEDPFGGNATETVGLQIGPALSGGANGTQPSAAPASPTEPAPVPGIDIKVLIGALAGGGCLLLLPGGLCMYLLCRKKTKSEEEEFRLSTVVVDKKFAALYGGGKYAKLVWSESERASCFEETGLIVGRDGWIGEGHYGKVSVCWGIQESCYAVMKGVSDRAKFQESIQEAELQKAARGRGVWPVFNYLQDDEEGFLRIFTPPAGLGDMDAVSRRITETGNEQSRVLFATYLAQDLLHGLCTLGAHQIYHNDLKGANVLVAKHGQAGIADFGCAVQSTSKSIGSCRSDMAYKSPEQLDHKRIFMGKEDAWAAGVALLEFLLNCPASQILNRHEVIPNSDRNAFAKHFTQKLAAIAPLQNPPRGSIFAVVKSLLAVNPDERGLPQDLLKASCFKQLTLSAKANLFALLIQSFQHPATESLPPSGGQPSTSYDLPGAPMGYLSGSASRYQDAQSPFQSSDRAPSGYGVVEGFVASAAENEQTGGSAAGYQEDAIFERHIDGYDVPHQAIQGLGELDANYDHTNVPI